MKDFESIAPFGPMICKYTLPNDLIEDFNNTCDLIVKNDRLAASLDNSESLVGKVHQEIKIPEQILSHYSDFFYDAASEYMKAFAERNQGRVIGQTLSSSNTTVQSRVYSAWFVRSFAGDYNPLHGHHPATLACVGYLKTPDWEEELTLDSQDHSGLTHGCIAFSYGDQSSLSIKSYNVKPKVGEFFLFPGWLQHTVYPYKSSGERRSFSMNFSVQARQMTATLIKKGMPEKLLEEIKGEDNAH